MSKKTYKYPEVSKLLVREANSIQKLATEQHKKFLGGKLFLNELLQKYITAHIEIVKELAKSIEGVNLKKGTLKFRRFGTKLAKNSLTDGLTLKEAVDGTIFLKQAIWQKLKDKGLLQNLDIDDFYNLSFALGTYCDVLVSQIAFVYHASFVKALEKQSQHKNEFMSIATHELKTPVTSLKAYTQVLENRFAKAGDEKSALQLAKMDAQLNKLTALIGDLLDATKIESGRLQFQEDYFDLNELVNETVEEMQRTTEKHKLIKKLGQSKTIFGDRSRIGQVLINLLSNSIKYSPHTQKIIISTTSDGEYASVSVKDYGIGIHKENHSKVFQRFQRVGNQNTYGGLGLGLYIASTIVKRHDGKFWLKSDVGKGSTFIFALPIKRNVLKEKNVMNIKEVNYA